jgi:teichoic acid transport system permease protein
MAEAQPFGEYVRDLWERRQFTMSLATGSLRAQHLDTTLGNLWHVLNPALLMAVYYVVFGLLLDTSRNVDNFIGFLAIGIFGFSYIQRTVTACGSSIPNNLGLIRSLQFPRAVLPISTVIRELEGYAFSTLVVLATLLLTGETPTLKWFLAPVLIALMTLFSAGLGMMVARLTDRIRDIANIIPYVFRLLFYLSGIIFSVDAFVTPEAVDRFNLPTSADTLHALYTLNPLYTYNELLKDVLMSSYQMPAVGVAWVSALVFAPVTFALGLVYFRGGEKSYGRG